MLAMSGKERPALKGNRKGKYFIQILGISGSGKSTLANRLSRTLNIPIIRLDELFWKPGWQETPTEEFRTKVQQAIAPHAETGWILDGRYRSKLGSMMDEYITDVIWLDPPFALFFPRLFKRTIRRLFRWDPPCREGCNETWGEVFFSSKSILWWGISMYRTMRKQEEEREREERGSAERAWVSLRAWGMDAALEAWLGRVEKEAEIRNRLEQ